MEERQIAQFVLDFLNCTTLGEIYAVIQEELVLPEWFGGNLDALWDALVGIMYTPAQITVGRTAKNTNLLDEIDKIIAVMCEAEERYHEITVIEKD